MVAIEVKFMVVEERAAIMSADMEEMSGSLLVPLGILRIRCRNLKSVPRHVAVESFSYFYSLVDATN